MDSYEIQYAPSFEKDLRSIPKQDRRKILKRIGSLASNPRPAGAIKLTGKSVYRVRQGDYRIVYDLIDRKLVVLVLGVGHRRDVYDHM